MPSISEAYEKILDQFSDVPNWLGYWTVFCELIDELDQITVQLRTSVWLDTAEGIWLDRCGQILGLPRPEEWVLTGLFTWDSVVANERWDAGIWNTTNGLRTGELDDDDEYYRNLLYARARYSRVAESIPNISQFITDTFGVAHTIDTPEADTVRVTLSGILDQRDRYYLKALAPVTGNVTLVLAN